MRWLGGTLHATGPFMNESHDEGGGADGSGAVTGAKQYGAVGLWFWLQPCGADRELGSRPFPRSPAVGDAERRDLMYAHHVQVPQSWSLVGPQEGLVAFVGAGVQAVMVLLKCHTNALLPGGVHGLKEDVEPVSAYDFQPIGEPQGMSLDLDGTGE